MLTDEQRKELKILRTKYNQEIARLKKSGYVFQEISPDMRKELEEARNIYD